MTSEEIKRIDELEDTLVATKIAQSRRILELEEKIEHISELTRDYIYRNQFGFTEDQAREMHKLFTEVLGISSRPFKAWKRPDQIVSQRELVSTASAIDDFAE